MKLNHCTLYISGETLQCNRVININSSPEYEDEFWQLFKTTNGHFKLFNAYYDVRPMSMKISDKPVIRIIAFINRLNPTVETFCQLWFKDIEQPLIVPVYEYRLMWRAEWESNIKGFTPYLLACKNPLKDFVPTSVSISQRYCERTTNNLKVIYNSKLSVDNIKKPFAVCVKDLDFMENQTKQIVEWIEILSLLGADKFFIYVINIHPNMMRTLQYYESIGKVQIERITEPKGLSRNESVVQWLQNEMTSLNDCLYKHMYEYDFLIPLDIDEILIPVRNEDRTWKDLLIRVISNSKNSYYSAYVASNVFFLSDNIHEGEVQSEIPKDMTFLQNIYRAFNFSSLGVGAKAFMNTAEIVVMHNHIPILCINNEYCTWMYLNTSDAQLSHYRKGCENYPPEQCNDFKINTVKDTVLWKWQNEIIHNVRNSMKQLENFGNL